jgi:hypothetical protein
VVVSLRSVHAPGRDLSVLSLERRRLQDALADEALLAVRCAIVSPVACEVARGDGDIENPDFALAKADPILHELCQEWQRP